MASNIPVEDFYKPSTNRKYEKKRRYHTNKNKNNDYNKPLNDNVTCCSVWDYSVFDDCTTTSTNKDPVDKTTTTTLDQTEKKKYKNLKNWYPLLQTEYKISFVY